MDTKNIEKYFFIGLLTVVTVFTIIMFGPFLTILIVGASLSVILRPLYDGLNRMFPKKINWLAALLTVLIFTIAMVVPVLIIGTLVLHQAQDIYGSIGQAGSPTVFMQKINTAINAYIPKSFEFNMQEQLSSLATFLSGNLTNVFTATLQTFLAFIIILLTIFYFLKDGAHWHNALVRLSPLSDADDTLILTKLSNAINGIIKGYVLIAAVQGLLLGVGLAIFGVPNPVLWGVIAGVASMVPTIGTALISVPAILFLFATGHSGAGVGLAIWSLVLVSTIDNFLNPIVVGSKTDIPPLLILFSVLGGITMMGPAGILIGPLTVSLLYSLISIYRTNFQHKPDKALSAE